MDRPDELSTLIFLAKMAKMPRDHRARFQDDIDQIVAKLSSEHSRKIARSILDGKPVNAAIRQDYEMILSFAKAATSGDS